MTVTKKNSKEQLIKEIVNRIEKCKPIQALYEIRDFIDFIEQKYDEDELSEDEIQSLENAEMEYAQGLCRKL